MEAVELKMTDGIIVDESINIFDRYITERKLHKKTIDSIMFQLKSLFLESIEFFQVKKVLVLFLESLIFACCNTEDFIEAYNAQQILKQLKKIHNNE